MASKLCCTAEQEHRPGSPELPNVRVTEATPATKPLLPKETSSPNSRFTSACSEDLHELQQIFDSAHQDAADRSPPSRLHRHRSSRPSMISLHSLHRMTSMRSILRRKFSKDMGKKSAETLASKHRAKKIAAVADHNTIVKKEVQKDQLKITKEDLRRDLLSDKKPHEGGYDSDAQVLDDVAKNIGKKTPGKRPSIREIQWTPSTGSKTMPDSAAPTRNDLESTRSMQPCQVQKPQTISFTSKIAQVFSTPNLRAEEIRERDRSVRRSHSATSMRLPKPSPLSPLRLPSLTTHDKDGTPWSEVLNQSLRLSNFPAPPRHDDPESYKTVSDTTRKASPSAEKQASRDDTTQTPPHLTVDQSHSARAIEIRVQRPTSTATPRASTSVRGTFHENAPPVGEQITKDLRHGDDEEDPRRSVHLYSMRISHHLRSGSLLSWDQLAEASNLPTPTHPFRERSVSDRNHVSQIQQQRSRHERHTSSSGFASSKVPSRWGKVVPNEHDIRADVASSIYSSRPQSPPDSYGGSMGNLSRTGTERLAFSRSSIDLRNLRRSNSYPTDNEETPRPNRIYGELHRDASHALLGPPRQLARKNSVAETKKSKFKEEFSPSPPKKRLAPSTSIMKFLNPKRLSLRSQSEASLRPEANTGFMDGPSDSIDTTDKGRRESRSIMSLRAEQEALDKNGITNSVWSKALKTHQEEKAAMFRPHNKELALSGSLFRERSGSLVTPRPSMGDLDPSTQTPSKKRLSAPLLDFHTPSRKTSSQSALALQKVQPPVDSSQGIGHSFERQIMDEDTGGAWGRYPSHTRAKRSLSAGRLDSVETRDFALEAAIRFASARPNGHDEDMIDPIERLPSPAPLPGQKKRKKKIGNGKLAKSHSMTFGRKLIKDYYAGIFKSSSSEFRQHGRGHRSSLASGGNLEYPELEMLPAAFMSRNTDGAADRKEREDGAILRRHSERHSDATSKIASPLGSSMATLRPRRNSSAPNFTELRKLYDVVDSPEYTQDRARLWSTYYENCMPLFPRISTDTGAALEDFHWPGRRSQDSNRSTVHSQCMPPRSTKHSRHVSQVSQMSNLGRRSARPSFMSTGENHGGEDKSIVSVRRSTMDLISQFKEQEVTEHERVLSLTRAESRRGGISEGA